MKADIEDLLGIKDNRPAINTNINREVEDLLRTRRPFARTANNTMTTNNNRVATANVQGESSNTVNKSREHSRSYRHKHTHRRVHTQAGSPVKTKHK